MRMEPGTRTQGEVGGGSSSGGDSPAAASSEPRNGTNRSRQGSGQAPSAARDCNSNKSTIGGSASDGLGDSWAEVHVGRPIKAQKTRNVDDRRIRPPCQTHIVCGRQ